MAITIDGTAGTIAGLVAGGLPSGSVTSATIADATIASGDIASGVVPAGGKVLQVVRGMNTNTGGYSVTTTSSSFVDVGVSVNITPASTSNYLLIFVDAWISMIVIEAGDQGGPPPILVVPPPYVLVSNFQF